MLCQQGDDSVFCGVDADFLDSDGIFAIKYRHDMEKLLEGIALPRMPWRAQYVKREQKRGRECLYLTCLDNKVEMYKKMDYTDNGISGSAWGGEEWHDMSRKIR